MSNRTTDPVVPERVSRSPYFPPVRSARGDAPDKPLRSLHFNESPNPPSKVVCEAMRQAAERLNRYPDHDGPELVAKLSAHTGVPADRIVIGSGSNELLHASVELTLEPGDAALAPDPGFPTYAKIIALRGATCIQVPTRDDGIVDVDATLAAVTPRTRLVFVTSPQNPTGGTLATADIERLVQGLPEHLMLHYDEAYYEFGRYAGGPDALPILAKRTGPWIATRSFSKAFGLAGARLGYGLCSSFEVAESYRKIRVNFSVNGIAMAGAIAALSDRTGLDELLARNAHERDRFGDFLRKLGLEVLPTAANFISFRSPVPCHDLADQLKRENILVLPFAWGDSMGAIRVTVGSSEDMQALSEALERILAPHLTV